jgi:hypothetical protein
MKHVVALCGNCERGNTVHARGMCGACYRRWRLYGHPQGGTVVNRQPVECVTLRCHRRAKYHNRCPAHASRWIATGDDRPDVPIRERRTRTSEHCGVTTCPRTPIAKGYCAAHLHRANRFGDPVADIAIGDPAIRTVPQRNS